MSSYSYYSDWPRKLQGDESEVGILVSKYKGASIAYPVLRELLKKPEAITLLWDVIEHHLSLIRSRSQSLKDNQVTIYDKTLLILAKNGRDMSNLGALNFYLQEFIGVTREGACRDMETILYNHVALKSSLMKLPQTKNSENCPIDRQSGQSSLQSSRDHHRLEIQSYHDGGARESAHDDKIARILAIYVKAKDEYYNLEDSKPVEKLQAARFLRDTAENTLNYLNARHCSEHRLIPELEENFELAKEKATQLSGGRKRRFEIVETDSKRLRNANRRNADCYRP